MVTSRRTPRLRTAIVASVAVLLLLAWPAIASAAAESFNTTRLTNDAYNQAWARVSGDRVVFMGFAGGHWQVQMWTPTGGIVPLTTGAYDSEHPAISGDRVAWDEYVGGTDQEIFTWTPTVGKVRLTDNPYEDVMPQVSGDRVVWQCYDGHDYEIYTWKAGGAVQRLTNNDINDTDPQVSGDRIVWQGETMSVWWDVFTWTPATGVDQLTAYSFRNGGVLPQVSGDRIVWSNSVSGDVYTWTPAGGADKVSTTTDVDLQPQVSGDRIVWYTGGGAQVYTWTPTGGAVKLTPTGYRGALPQISADRVVWAGFAPGNALQEIFSWTPGTGLVRITNNTVDDTDPFVSGGRVAWSGMGGSDWEIFTAVATPIIKPAVTSVSPSSGPASGGTGVIIKGSGFLATTSVTFGGVKATRFTVDSPTRIMAIAPAHALGAVRVQVTNPAGASPDSAGDTFTYVTAPTTTRYEQSSAACVWTGAWTLGSATTYSGGTFRFTDNAGSVAIPFKGTYLAWVAKTSTAYGIARVTVDGLRTYTVNLYSAATAYKKKVWDTGILPAGLHWVKIEWTGTVGAATGGTNVNLDAVDVAGTLVTATRTEQSNTTTAHLVWLPSYAGWTTGTNASYSGGSIKYIDQAGSVTVSFTGVRLTLVVKRSTAYGYTKVTVDGSTVYRINLYSAATLYRNKVWSTPWLTPGTHSVKIEWTGTKGATTGGTNVNLDAVDIIGTVK